MRSETPHGFAYEIHRACVVDRRRSDQSNTGHDLLLDSGMTLGFGVYRGQSAVALMYPVVVVEITALFRMEVP